MTIILSKYCKDMHLYFIYFLNKHVKRFVSKNESGFFSSRCVSCREKADLNSYHEADFQSVVLTGAERVSWQILSSGCFIVFLTIHGTRFVPVTSVFLSSRGNRLLPHSEVTPTCKLPHCRSPLHFISICTTKYHAYFKLTGGTAFLTALMSIFCHIQKR